MELMGGPPVQRGDTIGFYPNILQITSFYILNSLKFYAESEKISFKLIWRCQPCDAWHAEVPTGFGQICHFLKQIPIFTNKYSKIIRKIRGIQKNHFQIDPE